MKSLREIILEECLPQRDCMLTVQDATGEVGFLYFKDGELIEANYSAHWGKDAVEQVLDWQLAEYNVGALPLGIKRSVWDPVETVLRLNAATQAPGSSGVPQFNAAKIEAPPTPYDHFKEVEGVTKLFLIEGNKEKVLFESESDSSQPTEWMVEFYQRAKSVGDTLGFGKLQRWSLVTDRYQVVGLTQDKEIIGVLRKHDVGSDDFEATCQASIEKPQE